MLPSAEMPVAEIRKAVRIVFIMVLEVLCTMKMWWLEANFQKLVLREIGGIIWHCWRVFGQRHFGSYVT